jgi:hypothetical protein
MSNCSIIYIVSALVSALLILRTIDNMMTMCSRKPKHLQKAYRAVSLTISLLVIVTPVVNTAFALYWVYSVFAFWGTDAKP